MFITGALRTVRVGLKNVGLHKLRSTLTITGVVLGVASVIVMLAIGEAAKVEALRQIMDLGPTNIILRSTKPVENARATASQGVMSYGLTMRDLARSRRTVPTVRLATPMRDFYAKLGHRDRTIEARVVAVTPDFAALNHLRLARGRFTTDVDDRSFANVAVLAADVAESLFPLDDPIGRFIYVNETHSFRVVGVTYRRGPAAASGDGLPTQDYNRDVYIPFATDRARFGLEVSYQRGGAWMAEKLDMRQVTVTVRDMSQVSRTARVIGGMLAEAHPRKDYEMIVPLEVLERAERTQQFYAMVLGAIASISLVVGGIGIMNIMLATVTERTREIGIRRALGARRRDIVSQFLIETVVLSGVGGIMGVALGATSSWLVSHFFGVRTIIVWWSPAIALSISVVVGLAFGVYPAIRAARLDPIEALRHE